MTTMADVFPKQVLQLVPELENRLLDQARSRNSELSSWAIEPLKYGGKRIRPMLLMTSYFAAGGDGKNLDQLFAAAISLELIHTASLVHDDLMDQAESRRGHVSTYKAHGVDGAILVGDFLFTQAFALGALLPPRALQETAEAVRRLCEGQLQEQAFQRSSDATMEAYLDVIRGKTSSLLRAACSVGAILAGAKEGVISALASYGDCIGNAFQVLDDVLDIAGNPRKTGKPVGTDYLAGTKSSPILHFEAEGNKLPTDRKKSDFRDVRHQLFQTGSIARSQLDAASHTQRALLELEKLDASICRDSLAGLAELLMGRDS